MSRVCKCHIEIAWLFRSFFFCHFLKYFHQPNLNGAASIVVYESALRPCDPNQCVTGSTSSIKQCCYTQYLQWWVIYSTDLCAYPDVLRRIQAIVLQKVPTTLWKLMGIQMTDEKYCIVVN